MKKVDLIIILLLSLIGFISCTVKYSDEVNKDLDKKIQEDNKKNQDKVDQINKSITQGGQPGNIKVSGVIVKDDAKTDIRISVVSKSGVGKDGTEPAVGENFKPKFSTKVEKIDISALKDNKSLIAVGCDEKLTTDLAKERTLEIQKIPQPYSKDVMAIEAKTVVLCGKLTELKFPFLSVSADELILNNVDYTQYGDLGFTILNTNKLVLLGKNQVQSKGADTSILVSGAPSIELNVIKEISSDDDGRLLILAIGANYKPDEK